MPNKKAEKMEWAEQNMMAELNKKDRQT